MPNQPSRSDVHVNRPLSAVSVAFMQDHKNFVADQAFPIISSPSKSDDFYTYDRGMFNRDEMKELAPGARADAAPTRTSRSSSTRKPPSSWPSRC